MDKNVIVAIVAVAVVSIAAAAVVVMSSNGNDAKYTVTLVEGDNCDDIDNYSGPFKVKSGTQVSVDGTALTIGSTTYTATSADGKYTFDGWDISEGTISADVTVTASFSAPTYILTIDVDESCKVNGSSDDITASINYGASITVDGTVLNIGGTTYTAAYAGT